VGTLHCTYNPKMDLYVHFNYNANNTVLYTVHKYEVYIQYCNCIEFIKYSTVQYREACRMTMHNAQQSDNIDERRTHTVQYRQHR